MGSSEAIPRLKDSPSYEQWKSLIDTWSFVTKVSQNQKAEMVILTLEPRAQEVALKINKEKLRTQNDDGMKELIKTLDKYYKGDENQQVFTLCDEFENCMRQSNEEVSEFVNRWENLVEKLKTLGVTYSDPALAYKLIVKANIDPVSTRIIRSTIKDLTLSSMKETILKVFDKNLMKSEASRTSNHDQSNGIGSEMINIKEEPTFISSEMSNRGFKRKRGYNKSNSQYYNKSYSSNSSDHGSSDWGRNYPFDSSQRNWKSEGQYGSNNYWPKRSSDENFNNKRSNYNSRVNPSDSSGKPSQCKICGSIYHWQRYCNSSKRGFQHVNQVEDQERLETQDIQVNLLSLAEEKENVPRRL